MNKPVEPIGAMDEIVIRGRRIPVLSEDVSCLELHFYLENPRLYSTVRADGEEPTEEEIEKHLLDMEHVKALVQSIKSNGGLIDPVIVRGGDMVVLEGNSRLAAYRHLVSKDPIKWARMRAKILPADVSEAEIFALLGEYHIHGKTNWVPYEQAGYLYRRVEEQKVSVDVLAKEINLGKHLINHLIAVRKFMLVHGEDQPSRWSYYDEYLKGKKITEARRDYPELDGLVVKKIRSGEIRTAMELRDGLKSICQVAGKTLNKFADGKFDFGEAVEDAEKKGAKDTSVQRLSRFRTWLTEPETGQDIAQNPTHRTKIKYELEQIQKHTGKLLSRLNDS